MAYRRGDEHLQTLVDQATNKAEQGVVPKQMAQSYRLQANIAWNAMEWDKHSAWVARPISYFRQVTT